LSGRQDTQSERMIAKGPTGLDDRIQMIDIRPMLRSLYDGRRWVGVGVVAGMLLGVAGWLIKGVTYQSTVTLAVNQPRSGVSPISTASYRALFENASVASAAIQKAGLTRGGEPMEPDYFMRYVLGVNERRNTNLIQILIRLKDPQLAADVANDVAARAVALGQRLSQQDGVSLRDQLKSQRDDALKTLREAEKALLEYKQLNRIEMARTDVDSLIRQRSTLLAIEVELSSERAKLAAATAEQNARSAKLSLERRIDQDPTVLEAARSQGGTDGKSLLGLGLKTEEPNPTYLRLDSEVAMTRTKVAQLEKQRQAIFDASAMEVKNGKLSDLYLKELELAKLDSERGLARKVYEDISLRYENARTDATIGSAQLQITDPAFPIKRPVSWSVVVWMAIGAFAGALIFPAIVVLRAMRQGVASLAAKSAA
jgi:uncharacterized protein involved in exopolysaccharide biosynthesis